MHRHQPAGAQIPEHPNRLIGPHMQMSKGFRRVSADWQECDLRAATLADFAEAIKVRAVARVIDPAALVFKNKPAITTVIVPQDPGAPLFGASQRYAPVT